MNEEMARKKSNIDALLDVGFAHLNTVFAHCRASLPTSEDTFYEIVCAKHPMRMGGAAVIADDLDRNWEAMSFDLYKARFREFIELQKQAMMDTLAVLQRANVGAQYGT